MTIAYDNDLNSEANIKMNEIRYYSEYLDSIYKNNFIHDKSELLDVLLDYSYSIDQLRNLVIHSISNDTFLD